MSSEQSQGGGQYSQYPQGGYQQGGHPQGGYGYPAPAAQGNGIATAGMVCGIIGLVLFWVPIVGWILAILGIVFGGVGWSKANKGAPNKGMAIAGVVLGVASIALYVIVVAIVVNNS